MRSSKPFAPGTTITGSIVPPRSCFSEILADVLVRSTEELFGKNSITVATAAAMPFNDEHVAGLIGFEGAHIQGSLILVWPFDVAARSRPKNLAGALPLSSRVSRDWIFVRDWTGELANQLVGRVKNRLLIFGIRFHIATPVPLSGPGLSLAVQKRSNAQTVACGRGEECVRILVEITREPQLTSTTPNPDAEEAAREGDVIEF